MEVYILHPDYPSFFKAVTMKTISPEAIANVRLAVQHLFDCWDTLRELENEFDIEIETTDLSTEFGINENSEQLTDKEIIEFLNNIINNNLQCD